MNRRLTVSLAIIFLAACTTPPAGTQETLPTAPPASETPPPAPPTRDPGRTYNDEGGFSLQLPDGWTAIGPVEANAGDSQYHLYILGADPTLNGGPGASKIVIADAAALTQEAFILSQCSTCPSHPFEDITLGGMAARRTLVGGDGVPFTISWVFIEKDGKLIGLAIHDPETLAPLEDVLQSIRFD